MRTSFVSHRKQCERGAKKQSDALPVPKAHPAWAYSEVGEIVAVAVAVAVKDQDYDYARRRHRSTTGSALSYLTVTLRSEAWLLR